MCQIDLAKETGFEQPADYCPLVSCPAIAMGKRELERLRNTEVELREALARERLLLDQKDVLIRYKDLLGRESDHRLLNGLQIVNSLLSLQSRLTKSAEAAAQLKIAADRVATVGNVHRRLHALDHVGSVELKQYLEDLCRDMNGIVLVKGKEKTLVVEGISLKIPTSTAIPLDFIVSELMTNSAKYAKGKITVCLGINSSKGYALSVSDDGPGLPRGFDPKKSKGLGMKIISSLVKQIGGQLHFDRNDVGRGAHFTVLFS